MDIDLQLQTLTDNLKKDILYLQENITQVSFENPEMPVIWVWAFFSALMAISGHTVYQMATPQNIRRASERDFINERIDEELKLNPNINDSNLSSNGGMTKIVNEAREDYLYSHQSRQAAAFLASALYLSAMLMITVVIALQTKSVLVASGIWRLAS